MLLLAILFLLVKTLTSILFCYRAKLESHDLFFCPEPMKNSKKLHIWIIKATKERFGQDIYGNIFLIRTFLDHFYMGLKQAVCGRITTLQNSDLYSHALANQHYLLYYL